LKKFFNNVSKKISKFNKSSLGLASKFNKFVRRVKLKDIYATAVQTVKDMKSPKEIGVFISALIIPGGLPAYFTFKLTKYMQNKESANDNIKGKKSPMPNKIIKKPKNNIGNRKP